MSNLLAFGRKTYLGGGRQKPPPFIRHGGVMVSTVARKHEQQAGAPIPVKSGTGISADNYEMLKAA